MIFTKLEERMIVISLTVLLLISQNYSKYFILLGIKFSGGLSGSLIPSLRQNFSQNTKKPSVKITGNNTDNREGFIDGVSDTFTLIKFDSNTVEKGGHRK